MKYFLLITAIVSALLTACSSSDSSNASPTVTVFCLGDFSELIITKTNGVETYNIETDQLSSDAITVTGSRSGNTLMLQATFDSITIDINATIANDGNSITSNSSAVIDNQAFEFNQFGTLGACATADLNSAPVPEAVTVNFVDVSNDIENISLLRSAAGHDYSDAFESCRSMKHYLSPPLGKRVNSTVAVYAPFDGVIVELGTEEPNFIDDGVTNQKTVIRSTVQPSLSVTFFHIDLLSSSLIVGTNVSAGQTLGYGRFQYGGKVSHDFDIATHVNTAGGIRYVSVFKAMTDSVFADYVNFDLTDYPAGMTRDDYIITAVARDADPLTCSGETFTSTGTLASWVQNPL